MILVALFLFGAKDISDEEKKIMTIIIILLLICTFILSVATVVTEIWRLIQSSLNNGDSNIQITKLTSSAVVDSSCIESPKNSFHMFLNELRSCFAKDLMAYEFRLYSKFVSENLAYDAQIDESLQNLPEDISKPIKFLLSLSNPLRFSEVHSIEIASVKLEFDTLAKALSSCPRWYSHYMWNRLAFVDAFSTERKQSVLSAPRQSQVSLVPLD